jgi:hypothetical protein
MLKTLITEFLGFLLIKIIFGVKYFLECFIIWACPASWRVGLYATSPLRQLADAGFSLLSLTQNLLLWKTFFLAF